MFVTRRAEFSASHVCRIPALSDAENHRLYGEEANLNGHGHNYVVEVTIEGDPDPVTGMVIDLKQVKDLVDYEVIQPMDHRFLNYEVPPFDQIVPTAPNLANEIWRRLETRIEPLSCSLFRVRLYETTDLYVDVLRDVDNGDTASSDEMAA